MDEHTLSTFLLGSRHDIEYLKNVLVAGLLYVPIVIFIGFLLHGLVQELLVYAVVGLLLLVPSAITTLDEGGVLTSWLIITPIVVVGNYALYMDSPAWTGLFPPSHLIDQFLLVTLGAIVGFGTGGYLLGIGLGRVLGDPEQE